MKSPLLLLLLLLDCAAANKPAAHRLTSATNADEDADKLIVQHHHRHLSTYVDGGHDQACWYNETLVTCKDYFGDAELNMGPVWDQYAIWGNYTVTEGDVITFSVFVDNLTDSNAVIKPGKLLVEHANFHACKNETGVCTPLVVKSPGLVTYAPASQPVQSSSWPLVPYRRPLAAPPWPTAPCESCPSSTTRAAPTVPGTA